MSRPVRAEMVIRCPLCHDWREPAHVGNSVMVCEGCGQAYRVVYATPGNTGKRLGAMVRQNVKWSDGKPCTRHIVPKGVHACINCGLGAKKT